MNKHEMTGAILAANKIERNRQSVRAVLIVGALLAVVVPIMALLAYWGMAE